MQLAISQLSRRPKNIFDHEDEETSLRRQPPAASDRPDLRSISELSTPSNRPEYNNVQVQNFYNVANAASTIETCSHIYGYNDANHKVSMLQKNTATTILDYYVKLSSSRVGRTVVQGQFG